MARPGFKINLFARRLVIAALCISAFTAGLSHARAAPALLSLEGSGAAPNSVVTLTVGANQKLTSKIDLNGRFVFSNLKYSPEDNLSFSLLLPVTSPDRKVIANNLSINLNPYPGSVTVQGTATRAASIVVNLKNGDSETMIANQTGYFKGMAYAQNGLGSGTTMLTASIVNVSETCCPRQFSPFSPITLTVRSTPAQKASAEVTQGTAISYARAKTGNQSFAQLVPSSLVDKSWVNGFKEFANQTVATLTGKSASLGGFVEGQNNVNTLRSLQERTSGSINRQAPSEQVCRFGTLGLSLPSSETLRDANRDALMQNLTTRDLAKTNSFYGQNGVAQNVARVQAGCSTYYDPSTGNNALRGLCNATKAVDANFNSDVDYTSLVDIPETLQFNLTNSSSEADEQNILALADNLFPPQLASAIADADYVNKQQDYTAFQAVRNVAKNSFASLVSEKAMGSANSGKYMPVMLKSFGVDENSAKRLVGENPSYYAQMEIMTKKLFQNPTFTINLMDNSANVARQRTAMKGVSLQQQRDLLESLQRREMLLAVLLELKIKERAKEVSPRLTLSGQ